jgi:hypothetical protein
MEIVNEIEVCEVCIDQNVKALEIAHYSSDLEPFQVGSALRELLVDGIVCTDRFV